VEFVTVFRLTNVFVATVTSVRRVALAARYNMFPKMKEILKGRHFDDISQNQLQNCFKVWNMRWHRCITSQGECFEGNHSDIQQ
jgi:hypothetical protein